MPLVKRGRSGILWALDAGNAFDAFFYVLHGCSRSGGMKQECSVRWGFVDGFGFCLIAMRWLHENYSRCV